MKKHCHTKRIMYILLLVIIVIVSLAMYKEFRPVYSKAIKDSEGKLVENSISIVESVTIDGMEQWIQIRGEDLSNPVLLWLHGGPGSAQMPIYSLTKQLEKEFVVVHYDQRGAGKSNPKDFDESTMTIDRFVDDAYELTLYLKEKLNKDKIYLLGHSWGTNIGVLLARDYGEHYYAYIGVSQLVYHNIVSDQIIYDWLLSMAADNAKDLKKLENLTPPFDEHADFVQIAGMVTKYGGGMDISFVKMGMTALKSTEYKLSDYIRWLNGANRGSGPMWDSTRAFSALDAVPSLDIPIYLFMGRNDYNTPLELAEIYYNSLIAPLKDIVIFENSAHAPFISDFDGFYSELIRVKQETYN